MRKYLVRVSETMTTEVEVWAKNAIEAECMAARQAVNFEISDYDEDDIETRVITDFD